ncbi:unnamed protein product, partial [Protopolystoma xenopodis]
MDSDNARVGEQIRTACFWYQVASAQAEHDARGGMGHRLVNMLTARLIPTSDSYWTDF